MIFIIFFPFGYNLCHHILSTGCLPCCSTSLWPISRTTYRRTLHLTMISRTAVITAPSPSTQLSPAETKTSATVYSVVALRTVERCWPQTFGWRLCLGREKKSPSTVALPSSYRIWEILLTQHSSSVCEHRDRQSQISLMAFFQMKRAHGVRFWGLDK